MSDLRYAAFHLSIPRNATTDGLSAENSVMTPDWRWIVYASTHLMAAKQRI